MLMPPALSVRGLNTPVADPGCHPPPSSLPLVVVRLVLTAATGYSGALAPGPLAFASGMIMFNDQGVNQVLGVEPDGVRS